jgi:hypothetical protein
MERNPVIGSSPEVSCAITEKIGVKQKIIEIIKNIFFINLNNTTNKV